MKKLFVLVSIMLLATAVFPQAKSRKLPNSINHPSLNLYAPFISADGNALVFISDNAEDYALTPFFSFRQNADWSAPKVFPNTIYTRLNFLRGYALSADGSKLYYTTQKSPGVGGFDIWTSDWKGNSWSVPVNMAMPINSKGHEAAPSVTPDGKTMYFMRCTKMDQNNADGCTIFRVVKKPNGQWDEPEALPENINAGNSQAPRIMADGETLIFSSDKLPSGKGGMDLYITKRVEGAWSKPRPLDFVNTPQHDQYVSVTALGRYLVKDAMGTRKSELTEYLIPDELRPKGMMKIEGSVTDPAGSAIPAYIAITDLVTGKRFFSGRPEADGSFFAYIKEGTTYELAIDPERDNVTYFSKQFDLTGDRIPQIERVPATLKPLEPGDEIPLEMIAFKPYSNEVEITEATRLKKFMRLVDGNPHLTFEIQVLLEGYRQDSVQSDPDLTEVLHDSTHYTYDDIDSLGQLFQRDTIIVKTTYHNDRTWKQAESLVEYFVAQGAKEENFSFFANAIPATVPENRKLTIKAFVREKGGQ